MRGLEWGQGRKVLKATLESRQKPVLLKGVESVESPSRNQAVKCVDGIHWQARVLTRVRVARLKSSNWEVKSED